MSALLKVKQHPNGLNMNLGEERDISPQQNNCIRKKLLKEGVREEYPNYGDSITCRYTAYLGEEEDPSRIFDSSEMNGKDFTYVCLKGQVIRGFEQGVLTMKPGERAVFYIQPEYAFGRGGSPPKVPPGTSVTFDTEIISVKSPDLSEEGDESIVKKTLERATSFTHPNHCSMISLYLRGECEGVVFMEKDDVTFLLGEGTSAEYGIPGFVEKQLSHCKEGEYCRIWMKSRHCYGKDGSAEFGIGPDKDLTFYVKIKKMEQMKDHWEMLPAEKLERSELYKEKGNLYFKRKEFELAEKYYEYMIQTVENELCMEGEEEEMRKNLLLVGYLNMAQAKLKGEKYKDASNFCSKALKLDPNSQKGLFRRGLAYYHMQSYDLSRQDFAALLKLDPSNKLARNYFANCDKLMKKMDEQSKSIAKKMMSGIGKGKNDDGGYVSGMNDIGDWDNSMAQGMISLEEEREAFGETTPRNGGNNHGFED